MPTKKLTREAAWQIKVYLKQGHTPKEIAEANDVNVQTIYDIKNGRTWKI